MHLLLGNLKAKEKRQGMLYCNGTVDDAHHTFSCERVGCDFSAAQSGSLPRQHCRGDAEFRVLLAAKKNSAGGRGFLSSLPPHPELKAPHGGRGRGLAPNF